MLRKFIHQYSTIIKHFLLPARCVICGFYSKSDANLCAVCKKQLPILSEQCNRCATFLSGSQSSLTCGNCLKSPPPFDRVYALFPYQTPIPELIVQLKFHGQLANVRLFADLLFSKIQTEWYQNQKLPDLIIPVPLHSKRLHERGFNQAAEIAKILGKRLNMPIDLFNIIRTKNTLPQSQLRASLRHQNLSFAFQAKKKYHDLSIAILDDVITTGETVKALSQLLRQQGVFRIDVWCCARR